MANHMYAAGLVSIGRWIVFPVNFGLAGYLLLQCLHALTYACVHTGIQRRIVATVQETRGVTPPATSRTPIPKPDTGRRAATLRKEK